ncbi:regulatory protein, Fis family [Fibrobacter sp. UWB15]|uniref:sigma 54-interacting transcriptional regulator n=1 Tax=unclassified Fibrobacter TaxID=2634177 RepID=UPI000924381A|nr:MULTISPECIES: sigma-54 dependent transcriptional regulator [unclassified Fibrobacter]PWJ62813.1 regulatory Fis family protein [Fibrobacter sp. UWB6]SHG44265.1 regulatory protein, Fis family [Fibrobacter sp. UWB8]SMG39492.1 regulatory protein, Fis family [Fibrobacter sp. UWB15]
MNRHESMLRIAASSDISVLLLGESGSGKEVAARFVHAHSKRAGGPFIALNCGAIAKGLTESILEGHRKGAFTGAVDERLGVVRSADHGTLFLDEIGEMPLEIQCKLLRILQERAVMPLGSCDPLPVDFRLVCATNRNLRSEVRAGRFREDLFFRLNVFPIKIPPLREREDFNTIAQEIWKEVGDSSLLTSAEIKLLARKEWPGNVRQLKNVLQRYSLLKPYETTLSKILEEEFYEIVETCSAADTALYDTSPIRRNSSSPEWNLIYSELEKNKGNRKATAKKLGISRGCLYYQIRKHGS